MPESGNAPFTQGEWADEIKRLGGNLKVYVLSEGEKYEGHTVRAVHLDLQVAMTDADLRALLPSETQYNDWEDHLDTHLVPAEAGTPIEIISRKAWIRWEREDTCDYQMIVEWEVV